jgi:CRISPR-associated endonuclease Csy4
MKYYQDLRVLPDPEFVTSILLSAAFGKLHRALVSGQHRDVGVSFPNAKTRLGERLRLHGESTALERLGLGWLKGMRDYTEITGVQAIPESHSFCRVQRVQVKSNPERMWRRSLNNGRLEESERERFLDCTQAQRVSLPFLELRSQSTGRRFRLFVRQTIGSPKNVAGDFNTYGLSKTATVPWF